MILIPTHGRPKRLQELAASFSHEDLKLPTKVLIWPGDRTAREYFDSAWPDNWELVLTDPTADYCGPKLNWAYETWPDEPVYGFLADDTVLETPDLATTLCAEAGTRFIAHPNDGHHEGRLPTHFFVGAELARAAGFLAHPWFPQNCLDSVWQDIGEAFGLLRYRPDQKLIHKHPGLGYREIEIDDCYIRGNLLNKDAGWMYSTVYLPSPERVRLLNEIGEALNGKGYCFGGDGV